MKFETWNLGLLRIFFSASAILTDKVEVVLFGVCLRNPQTRTMLPNITLLTCYAMRTVVLNSLIVNIPFSSEVRNDHLQG